MYLFRIVELLIIRNTNDKLEIFFQKYKKCLRSSDVDVFTLTYFYADACASNCKKLQTRFCKF